MNLKHCIALALPILALCAKSSSQRDYGVSVLTKTVVEDGEFVPTLTLLPELVDEIMMKLGPCQMEQLCVRLTKMGLHDGIKTALMYGSPAALVVAIIENYTEKVPGSDKFVLKMDTRTLVQAIRNLNPMLIGRLALGARMTKNTLFFDFLGGICNSDWESNPQRRLLANLPPITLDAEHVDIALPMIGHFMAMQDIQTAVHIISSGSPEFGKALIKRLRDDGNAELLFDILRVYLNPSMLYQALGDDVELDTTIRTVLLKLGSSLPIYGMLEEALRRERFDIIALLLCSDGAPTAFEFRHSANNAESKVLPLLNAITDLTPEQMCNKAISLNAMGERDRAVALLAQYGNPKTTKVDSIVRAAIAIYTPREAAETVRMLYGYESPLEMALAVFIVRNGAGERARMVACDAVIQEFVNAMNITYAAVVQLAESKEDFYMANYIRMVANDLGLPNIPHSDTCVAVGERAVVTMFLRLMEALSRMRIEHQTVSRPIEMMKDGNYVFSERARTIIKAAGFEKRFFP